MSLKFDHLIAAQDLEQAQYEALAALQRIHKAFTRNEVFPHLAEMIRLKRDMELFVSESDHIRDALPRRISGVDWEEGEVRYEELEGAHLPGFVLEPLTRWLLPKIQTSINEGRTICDFVEEHADFETVGIIPQHQREGYLLIRVDGEDLFRVVRFAAWVLSGEEGWYHSLRTHATWISPELVDGPVDSPASWKQALLDINPDLPNPATFFLNVDVAFPFEETVLPLAKRRLLRYLAGNDARGVS
jgi:hypothetical protein